jgi:hypothetical protein
MPIYRHGPGDYEKGPVKRQAKQERKLDDYDIAFADQLVYVLDEHEWFDPHTSTKYVGGISRHAMYGPAVIVKTGNRVHESHVNDPQTWAWIRRCIAEGYLSAKTIKKTGSRNALNNEAEVEIRE